MQITNAVPYGLIVNLHLYWSKCREDYVTQLDYYQELAEIGSLIATTEDPPPTVIPCTYYCTSFHARQLIPKIFLVVDITLVEVNYPYCQYPLLCGIHLIRQYPTRAFLR